MRTLKYAGLKRLRDTLKKPIDFTLDDAPRMWTVLLGENGTCKTTLLQAIALAAVGTPTADQLARRVRTRLKDIMRSNATVVIEAEFGFDSAFHSRRRYPGLEDVVLPAPPRLVSRIELAPNKRNWTGTSQYIAPSGVTDALKAQIEGVANPLSLARSEEKLPWWLVAGYGVNRELPEPGAAQQVFDAVLDRLSPLFGDRALTATGFAEDDSIKSPVYLSMLHEALTGEDGLVPEFAGLVRAGRPAKAAAQRLIEAPKFKMRVGRVTKKLPAVWLSQGYQSIIAWIADLIGHGLIDREGRKFNHRRLSGLVLVDEIDLYVHPKWQVTIIAALKQTFPRVQFVATTHSPMVLPGLREEEILRLVVAEDGRVDIDEMDDDPRLKTGSELYSEFFGVDGLYPVDLARQAREYRILAANPFRSDAQHAQMQAIAEALAADDVDVAPAVARRSR